MGKYELVWREGSDLVEVFLAGEELRSGQTVIDFGCGDGLAAKEFLAKGLTTTLIDISPYCLDEGVRELLALFAGQVSFVQGCLWDLPELEMADWIYCVDALHKVPEEKVDGVLEAMRSKMRLGGFLSARTKNSHHPLKERKWWEQKIQEYFAIVGEDVLADDECFCLRTSPLP